MLRNTFFAVLTILAAAASSQAAIMLRSSDPSPLGDTGLVSYQIRAMGTAGEMINTFTNPMITPMDGGMGIHNVAQAFTGAGTPTKAEQAPGLWNAEWAPFDTHFLYGATDTLSLGPPYAETNDGSTSGMLGLPATPAAPNSGFGNYTSDATSTKVATTAGTDLAFMQVVMRAADAAMLSIRVIGDGGDSIGDFTGDNAFQIGGGVPPVVAPVAVDLDLGERIQGAVISHLFTTSAGTEPITWGDLEIVGPAPATAPTFTADGNFSWISHGSPFGSYTFNLTATNSAGTDTGSLMVELIIPEPATMTLFGLAMIGLVGFARRRS